MEGRDRGAERGDGHSMPKRKQPRNGFRQRVAVFVPEGYTLFADKTVRYSFQAWARNLSSGGIALLYPGQLKFQRAIISLSPDQADKHLLHVCVNRSRRVSQEFWEYGLQFESALNEEPAAAPE